jgi:hypothetical protein
MGVISSMEVRHGLPTLHSREFTRYLFAWPRLTMFSDVFIVWAKCKWDGKIRGFVLEKVYRNSFPRPGESILSLYHYREWMV